MKTFEDTAVIQVIYISTLKQVTLPRYLGKKVIYIALLDSGKSSVAAVGMEFNMFLYPREFNSTA